jgi:hypothetical protein
MTRSRVMLDIPDEVGNKVIADGNAAWLVRTLLICPTAPGARHNRDGFVKSVKLVRGRW